MTTQEVNMIFVFIDFILAVCLLMVLLRRAKNRTNKSMANNVVLFFCLIFFVKFILGFYFQRNFYAGYFYHWRSQPAISKIYFTKYLKEGPTNRILRIALHYDSGYPQALKMIGETGILKTIRYQNPNHVQEDLENLQ